MSLLLKVALSWSLMALSSCSSSPSLHGSWLGRVQGRADARKDLKEGKLVIEMMGPPPVMWVDTYQRLTKERYGIEHRWVAGCNMTNRVIGHADAYNEVMEAEIIRRFGKDALDKTAEEAKRSTPEVKP